jgi:DNA-binding XRE family transcriptional regulator
MMTLEEVIGALQDRSIPIVADRVGIHANTLRHIKNGKTVPSYETLKKLSDYFSGE